ncbi:hypothetical protein OIE66_22420 [Nonomuraea sp. NBC_01738]|nr:hypothetical protein OIE66_22420 [Nonomuraea sp. NBC_01738]
MTARAVVPALLAPLVQVALINRLPLPGGVALDLTLLAVLACALTRG